MSQAYPILFGVGIAVAISGAAKMPDANPDWTKTSTGTPTEQLEDSRLFNSASDTETLYYSYTHQHAPAEALVVEWTQQQAAGGSTTAFFSGASAHVEDGAAGYAWEVRVSTTGAVLYDPTAGADVDGFVPLSLSADDVVAYRVQVQGDAVQGWYRPASDDPSWTRWGEGALVSTGGSETPRNHITIGAKHAPAASMNRTEAYFQDVQVTSGSAGEPRLISFIHLGTDNKWPDTVPLFLVGAAVSVVGLVGWRRDKARKAASGETAEGQIDPFVLLATLLPPARALLDELDDIQPERLCNRVDALLEEYIHPFADVRQQVVDRLGMDKGAEILVVLAYGERMLNRTWSAAADGHLPEAQSVYPDALEAFEEAARLAQQHGC